MVPSMIITDAHVRRPRLGPPEIDAPLVVDPDAMIASEIAMQCFKAIIRWRHEILESADGVHHIQLAGGNLLEVHPAAPFADGAVVKKVFGVFVVETLDGHTRYYTLLRYTQSRYRAKSAVGTPERAPFVPRVYWILRFIWPLTLAMSRRGQKKDFEQPKKLRCHPSLAAPC